MPEWSNGFPYFLQFKSEFGNKEFMIWATVSSQSCFCWLYRASPSLAGKNIINLISVLMIWWGPCVESSLCWKRVFAMTSAFSWQNSVSLCPVSFCTPGANLPVAQVSLDFLFLHSSPLWWTEHHFLVLVLESLVGLHKTIQLQLLWHYWLEHGLGLLWYWMVPWKSTAIILFFFSLEIAPNYCILDSFVDY